MPLFYLNDIVPNDKLDYNIFKIAFIVIKQIYPHLNETNFKSSLYWPCVPLLYKNDLNSEKGYFILFDYYPIEKIIIFMINRLEENTLFPTIEIIESDHTYACTACGIDDGNVLKFQNVNNLLEYFYIETLEYYIKNLGGKDIWIKDLKNLLDFLNSFNEIINVNTLEETEEELVITDNLDVSNLIKYEESSISYTHYCDICNEKFSKRSLMWQHKNKIHYRYKCKVCNKKFFLHNSINKHLRMH